MLQRSTPLRLTFVVGLALCTSWSFAEPRRPPGAPPPPLEFEAPPPVVQPGPPQPTGLCTAILVVRQTETRRGCAIDERVTRAPGVLRYPCAGGPASADFGASRFTGSVQAGVVDLRLRTAFRFTDQCNWESVQAISGNLGNGELTFVYSESPMPGQARCAAACLAHGSVTVQR
jgi:hypothetical protein